MGTRDKPNDKSKRGFIQGTAGMIGLAFGGALSGYSDNASAAGTPPARWDRETDVLVVGGGGAGLAAAIEAGKAGARVLILEKSVAAGGDTFRNGGVMAGQGSRLTKSKGVQVTTEQVWNHFLATPPTFGPFDPAVARIVAERGGETIDWLADLGVKFADELTADPSYAAHLQIFHQVVGGGRGYAESLLAAAIKHGVQILSQSRATGLIIDGAGRTVGVSAKSGGKTIRIKAKRAVVLTTGGYAANLKTVEHLNPAIKHIGFVCSKDSVGDGLVMAAETGAIIVRTSQGPLLYPTVEVDSNNIFQWHTMQGGGIAVGEDGNRFVSEDTSYISGELTRSIIDQIDKQKAPYVWMIVKESPQIKHALEVHPVALTKADTIEELAAKTGLSSASLASTVDRFNRFCADQKDTEFGRKSSLIPLDRGPFYAGKVRPCAVLTTGGLKTDSKGRVLKFAAVGDPGAPSRAIPGLFAAGQVAEWSAVGGWTVSAAFTMGRVAGRNAAAQPAWS